MLSIRGGSSPRGRGKHVPGVRWARVRGLIPARAGKTRVAVASARASWAHPRAGGENYGVEIELAPGYGSSPRGRGKRGLHILHGRAVRLIPARAGKTMSLRIPTDTSAAHPRAGGENTF